MVARINLVLNLEFVELAGNQIPIKCNAYACTKVQRDQSENIFKLFKGHQVKFFHSLMFFHDLLHYLQGCVLRRLLGRYCWYSSWNSDLNKINWIQYLHSNNCIDEEEHDDQQRYVRQRLKWTKQIRENFTCQYKAPLNLFFLQALTLISYC